MANEVYANGREISCKAAAGKSIAAFPDVCLSPPSPPAGPVPIPYPNTGEASDTSDGSKTVQISGQEVMLKDSSSFQKSTGDEAATKSLGMGVVTHQITGKVYFTAWSMDVVIEGENAVRHLDLMTHNHASQVGNTPPWPYVDSQAVGTGDPCENEKDQEKKACGGKKRKEQCADEACQKAQKCKLVRYRKGKARRKTCCKGQTGHHMIQDQHFRPPGTRNLGTVYSQFAKYDEDAAPCVCVAQEEHDMMHAVQNVFERKCGSKMNYRNAKKGAMWAHKATFFASGCSERCMRAQIDKYYEDQVGVDNDTPLRQYDWPMMENRLVVPGEQIVKFMSVL
jgi:hypothetical protein